MTSVMWIMGCNPLCVGARDDHARDKTSPHLVSRTNKIYCYRPQQWMREDNVFTSVCQEFCPGGISECNGQWVSAQRDVCKGVFTWVGKYTQDPEYLPGGCLIGGVCLMGVCPGIYIPLPECILVAYYIFMVTAPFSKNKHSILKNRGGGV